MNLINKISNLFTSKKDLTFVSLQSNNIEFLDILGNDFSFGTKSKDYIVRAYGSNPYVYMVIDRITTRFVQTKKLLVSTTDKKKEISNPKLEEALKNPNSKEDGNEFIQRIGLTYLAAGECFVIYDETDNEFICPVNYNVVINVDSNGIPFSYSVTMFGNSKTYFPSEVLHIHRPDITVDTNHGYSNLNAGRKVWENNNEVWTSEGALHKNKGINGVLSAKNSAKGPMTEPERARLQAEYDREATGKNFGKVKVAKGEVVFTKMGMNPTDLKSIETRIEHLRSICAIYHVDSKLFGDPGASTYNNAQTAAKAMITGAVLPLADKIYTKLIPFMEKWTGSFMNSTLILDEKTIPEMMAPNLELSTKVVSELTAGILTAEEAKEILYPEL